MCVASGTSVSCRVVKLHSQYRYRLIRRTPCACIPTVDGNVLIVAVREYIVASGSVSAPRPLLGVRGTSVHVNISDHKGIFCIDNNTLLSKNMFVLISKRNFCKRNILKFTFNIHKVKWNFVHNLPVQSAFRRFLGVIVQHFENSFPKRTFTLTYKTCLPWMTPDLRQQICEKNAMYKATLSDPQNKELLIEYKKNKNLLNSQLKYFTTQMN